MRTSFLVLGAAAGAAIAQPHQHQHAHKRSHLHHRSLAEKRAVVEQVVTVTVLECDLNGRQLSEAECNEGVKNGTLRWADDGGSVEYNPVVTNLVAVPSSPTPSPQVHAENQPQAPPKPSPVAPPPPPPAAAPPAPPAKPAVATNNRAASGSSGANVNAVFPSGELSCDQFPSDFGAVPAPWLGLGGWLSVQKPATLVKRGGGGFSNIMTTVPSQCPGGNCCNSDGAVAAFCSYACPSGYFKTQWPSTQGSTGQSIGGLQCQNGKLVLSNPQYQTLCMPGATQVSAYIENRMGQDVSICQTNYPGDEAMTIPLLVPAGQKVQLAIQDQTTAWRTTSGQPTTAQYYVNPAGVGVDQACRWDGTTTGNWAPMVMGAGWNGAMAYMSLFQNLPTQASATLNYKISLEGGSMPCTYQNGQICTGGSGSDCGSVLNHAGCTVALNPGQSLTYVLS
jgi:hypothetical protein